MIRGRNVQLTEIQAKDKEKMFLWINDADTVHFNAPYKPVSWSGHQAWFESLGKDPSRIPFAIRKNSDRSLIGAVQLFDIHPIHRSAELSIRLGSDRDRGQGLGTEAVSLALQYAWNELNLVRVWLRVLSSNARAINAYLRVGMKKEGVMKKSAFINGKFQDQVVMAALRPGR